MGLYTYKVISRKLDYLWWILYSSYQQINPSNQSQWGIYVIVIKNSILYYMMEEAAYFKK